MYVAGDYKFDARAQRVLDVCKAGGKVRYALESSYRGGEKFQTRVYDASGFVVPGLGYKSAAACIARGLLKSSPCSSSSAYASEYVAA